MNFKTGFATVVAVAALSIASGTALAADKVSFAFDWIVNGTHAGYFVAKSKGYYRDAGMDVDLSRGFGSGDTVKRVGAGAATFGVADASVVIAARANEDIPVRMVAVVFGKAPLGVIYLAESGIKGPKDLAGRTIGRSASGSSVNMFPGFLKANGVERSSMREMVADANTLLPMLMSRRVDAVLGQTVNIGRYKKMAEQQGMTAMGMNYADFGLEAYGNAIIADAKTIETQPDLVKRFVEASMKGVAYALANPDEAAATVKQIQPEADLEVMKEELAELRGIVLTDEVKTNGVGYASPRRMGANIDMVTDALSLKRKLTVEDVYAAQFQPKPPILP